MYLGFISFKAAVSCFNDNCEATRIPLAQVLKVAVEKSVSM